MENQVWQFSDYVRFLKSEKANVRDWALRRCMELFGTDAKREIAGLLNDPDEDIAASVLAFLGEHKLVEYAPAVLKKFNESSGSMAGKCAIALGEMGRLEVQSLLRMDKGELSQTSEKLGIIEALGNIKTADSLETIMYVAIKPQIYKFPAYIAATIYLAALKHNLLGSSRKILEHALDGIGKTGDKERVITDLAKHFINPNILEYLEFYREQEREDIGAAIYKDTGLAEFDPDMSDIIKWVRVPVDDITWLELIRLLNSIHSTPSLDTLPDDMVLDYKLGNLLLLKSFGRAANAIAKQSEEIRESATFSALAAHLSILEYEHIHLPDDKDHLRQLFRREVEFRPDFEEALLDRVAALRDTDMAGWCEALINEDPYSTAAGRAANLLGRFGGGEAVRILVYSLALDGSDYLYDTAIDALKRLQDPQVITRLAPVFESGNRSGIIAALGALRNYPVQETVDLVSKHFHKLWIDYSEPLLRLIESIASADFIPQLKKEVKSGETYVEEVYVLLCDLHNVHDPDLADIRRQRQEIQKMLRQVTHSILIYHTVSP